MQTVERPATNAYGDHVNPHWVKLLSLLDMHVSYEKCLGAELFTTDGRRILDFLSGYCVHNAGHNHPAIISALKDELDKSGPVMLQSNVPELQGAFANWRAADSPRCSSQAQEAKVSKPQSSSHERTRGESECSLSTAPSMV